MELDYKQVLLNLQASQVAEAKAKAESQKATAIQGALKKAAELNAKAARQASLEAQEQVTDAAKSSAKAQEKADEAVMNAEAAIAGKCKAIWDKKNLHARPKQRLPESAKPSGIR